MPLPDIDFAKIRPHNGSRNTGFEELCCQIAALQARPAGSTFARTGRGGDAGVECFLTRANGTERGWQAKYVFAWDKGLSAQLDESIDVALSKHPLLTEYVVCIPFDLPDPRQTGRSTAAKKWSTWKAKWETFAQSQGRTLDIVLWGQAELTGLLAIDRPEYSGRVYYWFGRELLTSEWFVEQFGKVRSALGSRYTPETNVELPIRRDFLAFARDPFLESQIEEWDLTLVEKGVEVLAAIRRVHKTDDDAAFTAPVGGAVDVLRQQLAERQVSAGALYEIVKWKNAVESCIKAVRAAQSWVFSLPPGESQHGTSREDWARHELYRFSDFLNEMADELDSDRWRLANARSVLLKGPAGSGKSHLLADIVEHQIHEKRPAVLIMGSVLVEGEPWRQVMQQLDLSLELRVKDFLGCLDAAGEAAGVRAIVCIDAVNERHGPEIWPERLASFLAAAAAFPFVGIALSCRSTYLDYVIPDSISEDVLPSIVHQGFGGDGGEAANTYLSMRGIVRPGAPNLVPEFLNPLFLKTCCDFLLREGRNELPRGLRGVSAIFGFYFEAVVRAVTRRMKLDPHLEIIPKALGDFTDLLVKRGEGYAPKAEVISAFEALHRSGGQLHASLLAQLENEGILAIEPAPDEADIVTPMVRFTFERYSDHAIATKLLKDNVAGENVSASFAEGTALGDLVFGEDNHRFAGIIEAIAIQLPERTGVEIMDLHRHSDWTVRSAFTESLLWREQAFFSDRTFALLQKHSQKDEVRDILISVSTEPDNKFNAEFLHSQLAPRTMPDRDRTWSVALNHRGEHGDAVATLINWALQNGMGEVEAERARLSATVLAWFLSTSNRVVRDKTTKALTSIFSVRFQLRPAADPALSIPDEGK